MDRHADVNTSDPASVIPDRYARDGEEGSYVPEFAQSIGFCTSADGVRIAYAVSGEGPPMVKTGHWMSHVEFDGASPVWRPWLDLLSRHRTLVRFDPRGCGLSDHDEEDVSREAWQADLEAVVAALDLDRFDLIGMSQGAPVAIGYAHAHPDRVQRLLLYGAYARGRAKRGLSAEQKATSDALVQLIRTGWGQENPAFRQLFTSLFIPGGSDEQVEWFNELQRISTEPEMAARIVRAADDLDATQQARELRVPTLVLHAARDARVPVAEGRLVASLIPEARFVELDSDDHVLLDREPAWNEMVREVAAFLELPAGEREAVAPHDDDRADALATLTPRERDVLDALSEGRTNKQIAKKLGLTPKTARNYVSLVLSKLGAATRTEAAAIALRLGRSDA